MLEGQFACRRLKSAQMRHITKHKTGSAALQGKDGMVAFSALVSNDGERINRMTDVRVKSVINDEKVTLTARLALRGRPI